MCRAAWALVDGSLHEVDDDSGDGDVEPDGEGVAGELLVGGEASGEGEEKGDEDEGQCNHGEQDVGGEELPVEGPPGAEAVEMGVAVESMVGDVADEEGRRKDERGEHGIAVFENLPVADEVEADEQGDGAEAIEERVDAGEEA